MPNWAGMASNAKWLGSELAKKAWSTNTGKGALIGAGAGAAWSAVSDDTSILGGMAMGAAGGAAAGRYGSAGKAMWGSKYGQKLSGGARLAASARQAGVQLGADVRSGIGRARGGMGRARGWWGGGRNIASNGGIQSSGAMASSLASVPSGATLASNQGASITDLARSASSNWGKKGARRAASQAGVTGQDFTARAQRLRRGKGSVADLTGGLRGGLRGG